MDNLNLSFRRISGRQIATVVSNMHVIHSRIYADIFYIFVFICDSITITHDGHWRFMHGLTADAMKCIIVSGQSHVLANRAVMCVIDESTVVSLIGLPNFIHHCL